MSRKAENSQPFYQPEDQVPLPPKNAEVITTCCDYCVMACGFKVYRWPVGAPSGGPRKNQNALGLNYPLRPGQGGWVGPNQYTQGKWQGKMHHIAVVGDHKSRVVNVGGGHSIRGGCIAQKVYNPQKPTQDRLQHPMVRINDLLMPVTWDFALDIAAAVSKHVIKMHGESAWAMKYFSYQYFENTYALTKLALKAINSPAVAHHDHPSFVNSVPGWVDIGYDIFSASHEDFALADCILISGTDPFETKTTLWNHWILKGINGNHTKVIMINPRRTAGVAYAEKHGGLHLDILPGSDTAVHMAIERVIVENGWQDTEFINRWVANHWETDSGFGQGTRNTPWQWRTTWGKFQVKGFEDWKEWLLAQEESKVEVAARIAGIGPMVPLHSGDSPVLSEWGSSQVIIVAIGRPAPHHTPLILIAEFVDGNVAPAIRRPELNSSKVHPEKAKDVLILAEWEAFYFAKLRVLQLLIQLLQEVFSPRLVVGERHT